MALEGKTYEIEIKRETNKKINDEKAEPIDNKDARFKDLECDPRQAVSSRIHV